jgi:hypothetical protein
MARLGTMKLAGASGTTYSFHLFPWATSFKAIGAVYFVTRRFAKSSGGFQHERIYLGQTRDLSEGFAKHTQKDSFKKHSANCIFVLHENDDTQRQQIEKDLLPKHKTLCNS